MLRPSSLRLNPSVPETDTIRQQRTGAEDGTGGEEEHFRETFVNIDLGVIIANIQTMRSGHAQSAMLFAAVVKADAYGHGALQVAQRMSESGVVDAFVVALVEEGLALRRGGIELPIIVTAGSFSSSYDQVIRNSLIPVVGSSQDLQMFSLAGQRLDRVVEVHLEVDVGMARLGTPLEDLAELKSLAQGLASVHLAGIMAHPSHGEEAEGERTERQTEMLLEATHDLSGLLAKPSGTGSPGSTLCHIANSGALASLDATSLAKTNVARVGLAVYGIQPIPTKPIKGLKPALSWYAGVVAVRRIGEGVQVGYDGNWTSERQSVIATIGVGYGDGYPRSLSNRGEVVVQGRRAPVVGNLCMDYTMVDVTDIPGVCVGDRVTLVGEGNAPSAADVAARAGTIPWEILSRISTRVPRRYVG